MKAVLALLLIALLVVCAQSRRLPGYNGPSVRPRWPKLIAKRFAVEDEEESDFWMALAPLAVNLIKNKLAKKRDDYDEEADFINLKKVWGVAKNIGKQYLSSKYGINLDEEEESDSEFLSKLKNWWNSKGKDLAIKGLQIYSQIKNGGAQQGDEVDEEEADLKLGNFFKKALNVAKNVGKQYLSSKYGINLDEEEEADFINWKKVWGTAKDIGKNYLSTKYGINLDEEEESDSEFLGKINWKKIGGIAKDIGKTYLSSKYGINLDEEEESDSEFIKINWKKIGNIAKDIGKTYLSSKYGINLDEAEEESDQNRSFDFGANVNNGNWNVNAGMTGQTRNGGSYNVGGNFGNGGQWGVNGGYDRTWNSGRTSFGATGGYGNNGFNAGVKFSHRFDDIEEADFINWKKVWGVAKDIGKNYISTKYGINLDEEEEY